MSPILAEDRAPGPPVPPARPGAEPMVLALDVSGSMRSADGAGGSRWETATAAAIEVIEQLPIGTPVGLRLFGHIPSDVPEVRCAATELAVPVAPATRNHIDAAERVLAGFGPAGHTPIGATLVGLAQDLPEGGRAVLISDGEDTCHPPGPEPCAAAGALEGIRVDTVGFQNESPGGAGQLRCIADATAGTYHEARDAAALVAALQGQLLDGDPVQGARRAADAPLLQAGRYLDGLRPGDGRWYAVELAWGTVLGVTATAAASAPLPDDADIGLAVEVHADDVLGTVQCAQDAVEGRGSTPLQVRVEGPRASAGGPCNQPGRHLIQLRLEPSDPAGEVTSEVTYEAELAVSIMQDPQAPSPPPDAEHTSPRPVPRPVGEAGAEAPEPLPTPVGVLVGIGVLGLVLGAFGGVATARLVGP